MISRGFTDHMTVTYAFMHVYAVYWYVNGVYLQLGQYALSLMSNRKHIGGNVYILLIPCAYLSPSLPYLPSHDALDALNVFVV